MVSSILMSFRGSSKENDFKDTIIYFTISVLIFCEVALVVLLIVGRHQSRNPLKKILITAFLVSTIFFLAQMALHFNNLSVFVEPNMKYSGILWFVSDSIFALLYLAILLVASFSFYRYKLPLKEHFFIYIFYCFTYKILFLSAEILMRFDTDFSYW
ncbi:transmembrane protein adipocyte-associated 1 [Anaeramoeba flamelloides]|uniref:Transmembrane protein adipocyte-associated 1 n=1 Tax=Anaeramoeba flamelloides TaxID=1746091 RepID=A0ABQ8YBK1_9EUKA|nr:transmembrane protein adipocyte-associated 1 [Anaeramoeba flamelloides]